MSFQRQIWNDMSSSQRSSTQYEAFSRQSVHYGLISGKLFYMILITHQLTPFFKDDMVQHSCSEEFLIILCLEFCKAQSHSLISRIRDLEQEEQEQRLRFLIYEITRLLKHPQLFPSELLRVRFLTFLAVDSRFQMFEATSSLLMQNEVHVIQETWQKNISRKGYLKDTRGWENFLLSNAPGLSFTTDQTVPKSMVQIMPPIASRIVGDFEREEREILRFVEQVVPLLNLFGACSFS